MQIGSGSSSFFWDAKRKEALMIVAFLAISQILLAYFVGRIASDGEKLLQSESALAASNQRLEQIVYQLRTTADTNYRDAITQLRQKKSAQALKQINLALVGVAESLRRPRQIPHHSRSRQHPTRLLLGSTRRLPPGGAHLPNSLPIAEVETDLTRTLEDGFHPQEGWNWEKISLPPPAKLKSSGKPGEASPPLHFRSAQSKVQTSPAPSGVKASKREVIPVPRCRFYFRLTSF
jgi:hypothetical protein